jgi:hypothetical protein
VLKAEIAREIVVESVTEPDLLATISRAVAEKGAAILAVMGRVEGVNTIIHLMTDDNERAIDALGKKQFEPYESRVLVAEFSQKPGMWKRIASALEAAEISISRLYGGAGVDDENSIVVMSTSDDEQAVVRLNDARTPP